MKTFVKIMAGITFSPILLVLYLLVFIVLGIANLVELVRAVLMLGLGKGWEFHFWTVDDLDWE